MEKNYKLLSLVEEVEKEQEQDIMQED